MKFIIPLLISTALIASANPDGALLFTNNCSACHQLDKMVVGPSLVEIRELYKGKPDAFVRWSINPGKKRKNVIEMPAMVHVGEEGLLEIYEHIMKVAEGVKAQKQAKGDPFAVSPTQAKRPQIQRIFMPGAGPASIAVALDDSMSLCWDAGECRFRYAWNGGFIDGYPYWRGNGNEFATVLGNIRYVEEKSPFPEADQPKFLGYKIENELPVFRYQLASRVVTETFSALPDGGGFTRTFTISPTPSASLEMDFPANQTVEYSSDKGTWDGSKLKLAPAESAAFTINISFK